MSIAANSPMSIAANPPPRLSHRTPLDPIGPCPAYDELLVLLGDPRGSGTYYAFEQLTGHKDPRGWRTCEGIT